MKDNIKTASDIVFKYLKGKNINKLQKMTSFFSGWEEIAGDVSKYGSIKDIKNSTLIVETDHPAKSTLIQAQKRKIIYRINNVYPELEIKDMVILVNHKKVDEIQEYMNDVNVLKYEKKEKNEDFEQLLARLRKLADNQS
ncbi:MAG: DUF721 domain-containing protein [Fusobacteriaceae bacterium]|nr:DUF721 domain-containing protein [Fusobacteriaceae bacterium]